MGTTITNPSSIPSVAAVADADEIVFIQATTGRTIKMPATDFAQAALAEALANDQAAVVAAPSALTSAAITGGESPTEAEHNALQADVAALRTTVANILTSLKNAEIMANA